MRAMFPQGVGDESFLDAARVAADDERISAYARNQLRAGSFVLGRVHRARSL